MLNEENLSTLFPFTITCIVTFVISNSQENSYAVKKETFALVSNVTVMMITNELLCAFRIT